MIKAELKTNNIKVPDVPETQLNKQAINEQAKDTSKGIKEPIAQQATKHVVLYLGCGVFTDSTGYKWRRGSKQTFDDAEYASRDDIKFMVSYGEMEHTEVTV